MSGNMNLGITSSSVLTTYPQTMTCIVDGTNIIQVDFTETGRGSELLKVRMMS